MNPWQPSASAHEASPLERGVLDGAVYLALWLALTLAEIGWSGMGTVLLSPLTAFALLAGRNFSHRPQGWIRGMKAVAVLLALLLGGLNLFNGHLLHGLMLFVFFTLLALCCTLVSRREVFMVLLASIGLMLHAAGYASARLFSVLLPLYLGAVVLVLMQLQGAAVRAEARQYSGAGRLLAVVPVLLCILALSALLQALLPRPPALNYELLPAELALSYGNSDWEVRAAQQGRGPTAPDGAEAGFSGATDRAGAGGGGGADMRGDGRAAASGSGDAGLSREPVLGTGAAETEPAKLLLRVHSDEPVDLRTFVYDHFNGESWSRSAGPDRYVQLTDNRFERAPASQDPPLQQQIEVVAELDGVLPHTPVVHRIELPSRVLRFDHLGAIYLPDKLRPGLSYSVSSTRSQVEGRRLLPARAEHPESLASYLQRPTSSAALCEQADTLTAGREPMASGVAIERYLLTEVGAVAADAAFDPQVLTRPLGTDTALTPMQKLSAFVLMMRCQGIPARLVGGYASSLRHPFSGVYEVSSDDAVVWSEIWLPALGWARFTVNAAEADAVPEGWLEQALAYVEQRLARDDLNAAERLGLQATAGLLRGLIGLSGLIQSYPLLAALLLLVLLTILTLLWRYRRPLADAWLERRLRQRLQRQPDAAAVHLFAALESWFGRRGQARRRHETAQRYGARLMLDNPWLGDLAPLLQAFNRQRYGRRPASSSSAPETLDMHALTPKQALRQWRHFRRLAREQGWNV